MTEEQAGAGSPGPGISPELTLRFSWHVDGLVAGSARPGRYGDIRRELALIKDEGIRLIVNLCTEPLVMVPTRFWYSSNTISRSASRIF